MTDSVYQDFTDSAFLRDDKVAVWLVDVAYELTLAFPVDVINSLFPHI